MLTMKTYRNWRYIDGIVESPWTITSEVQCIIHSLHTSFTHYHVLVQFWWHNSLVNMLTLASTRPVFWLHFCVYTWLDPRHLLVLLKWIWYLMLTMKTCRNWRYLNVIVERPWTIKPEVQCSIHSLHTSFTHYHVLVQFWWHNYLVNMLTLASTKPVFWLHFCVYTWLDPRHLLVLLKWIWYLMFTMKTCRNWRYLNVIVERPWTIKSEVQCIIHSLHTPFTHYHVLVQFWWHNSLVNMLTLASTRPVFWSHLCVYTWLDPSLAQCFCWHGSRFNMYDSWLQWEIGSDSGLQRATIERTFWDSRSWLNPSLALSFHDTFHLLTLWLWPLTGATQVSSRPVVWCHFSHVYIHESDLCTSH